MSALIVIVIASILVAAGFLIAFLWSVKDGQYDDNQGDAFRMLYDDEVTRKKHKKDNS